MRRNSYYFFLVTEKLVSSELLLDTSENKTGFICIVNGLNCGVFIMTIILAMSSKNFCWGSSWINKKDIWPFLPSGHFICIISDVELDIHVSCSRMQGNLFEYK